MAHILILGGGAAGLAAALAAAQAAPSARVTVLERNPKVGIFLLAFGFIFLVLPIISSACVDG